MYDYLGEPPKINAIKFDGTRLERACFNYAIAEEMTRSYPFRRFKIKGEPTRKRALSAEQLRAIFSTDFGPIQKYVDCFKLTFLLIGINTIDLLALDEITDGRVNYTRAKTGKRYSVMVEPEAMEIIRQYRGQDRLVSFGAFSNYHNFVMKCDLMLKRVFPGLSLYWARHSWATIAASIDVPTDVIARALGHSFGNPTTNIYIDFDLAKVDNANRAVIDYICR